MLSKCANPDCSETFRYLHQGKIFCLAPTPEVETLSGELRQVFGERFWLCTRCSKVITLIWGGNQVRLVRLPIKAPVFPLLSAKGEHHELSRKGWRARAASAGRDDR